MNSVPDLAPGFVSELMRAATDIQNVTSHDKADLLQRAAASLQRYRERIVMVSEDELLPVRSGELTHDLRRMAHDIGAYTSLEIVVALFEAVGAIRICEVMVADRAR